MIKPRSLFFYTVFPSLFFAFMLTGSRESRISLIPLNSSANNNSAFTSDSIPWIEITEVTFSALRLLAMR